MSSFDKIPSDESFKIDAYHKILSTLDKSGVPLGKNNLTEEAIAFILETLHETYYPIAGNSWRTSVDVLLDNLESNTQKKHPDFENSWLLEKQFEHLFKTKLEHLAAKNPKQRKLFDSINKLHKNIVDKNEIDHKEGKVVHIGGLPEAFIPKWYHNLERKEEVLLSEQEQADITRNKNLANEKEYKIKNEDLIE